MPFSGILLGERGVLTEASLFRTHPNHVHTYFIKYPAAEYATPKPDGNLTLSSPCERGNACFQEKCYKVCIARAAVKDGCL